MLDKIYFRNGHLTSLAFFMLENDEFNPEEKQLILSHISSCENCMECYVESLTEDSLIEPSASLANSIMDAIHSQQDVKKNTKVLTVQFAKLAIAVCLTMVIFFSGAFGFAVGSPEHIQNDILIAQQQKPVIRESKFDLFNSITSSLGRGFLGFADKINLGFKGDANNGAK